MLLFTALYIWDQIQHKNRDTDQADLARGLNTDSKAVLGFELTAVWPAAQAFITDPPLPLTKLDISSTSIEALFGPYKPFTLGDQKNIKTAEPLWYAYQFTLANISLEEQCALFLCFMNNHTYTRYSVYDRMSIGLKDNRCIMALCCHVGGINTCTLLEPVLWLCVDYKRDAILQHK